MNGNFYIITYLIGILVGVFIAWLWWGHKAMDYDKMKKSRDYYLNKYNEIICDIYKKTIGKEL